MVTIKNGNPSRVSTAKLLKGMMEGFSSVYFEMEAVPELLKRGQRDALVSIYETTPRKFAKFCIRKLVIDA